MGKRYWMGARTLVKRGSLLIVELPPTITHEQAGRRPCIAVSSEESIANARYDMIVVVPLTTTKLTGRLYPEIKRGDGSLKKASVALVDQIRSIDKKRLKQVGATFSQQTIEKVDSSIQYLLGYAD